jgi:drug/metabolite transporter (DMT)-like permease
MSLVFLNSLTQKKEPYSKYYWSAFLYGAVFYGISSSLYFYASERIGTGIAMVLFYVYPVLVALLSWKFDQKTLTRFTLAAFGLIFSGLLMISGIHNIQIDFYGLLYSFGSAVLYALYVFKSKKDVHQISSALSAQAVCLGGAVSAFLICLFTGSLSIPPDGHTWAYIAAIGIFSTALPIYLLLKGMEYVGATEAAILSSLEPLATVVVGVLFLEEILQPLQWIGAAVILLGAGLAQGKKSES